MEKFRKKPVVIEAIQWNGQNLKEIIDFTGLNPSAANMAWKDLCELVDRDGLKVFTREGKMSANIGDWVVKGNTKEVGDHCWVVKSDYFEQNYESVSA